MKKFFLLMALCLTTVFAALAEDKIYAVWDGVSSTMTLRYDDQCEANNGVTQWWQDATLRTATTVVLNVSMINARPTSTEYWFMHFTQLTEIRHLDYLNTSEVTNMSYMFYHCVALASLDLSNFNTANVTNMSYLFCDCESLTSLDVSTFNTEKVTTMEYMFRDCKKITSLDVTNFNTASVIKMNSMFSECYALTSIDVSKFNTANVIKMNSMFWNCYVLTSLDLSSFNTEKVTNMKSMFWNCKALTTIYWDEDLSTRSGLNSESMFFGCKKLQGGNGTAYDENHIDASYARPDKLGQPGYFSSKRVPQTKEMTPATGVLYWDEGKSTWSAIVYDSDTDPSFVFSLSLPGEQTNIPTTIILTDNTDDENVFSNIPASGAPDFGDVIKNAALIVSYDGLPYVKDFRQFIKAKISGEMTSAFGDKLIVKAPADFVEFEIKGITIPAGVESIQHSAVRSQKVLRNGQLFIERGGKMYNVQGAQVK